MLEYSSLTFQSSFRLSFICLSIIPKLLNCLPIIYQLSLDVLSIRSHVSFNSISILNFLPIIFQVSQISIKSLSILPQISLNTWSNIPRLSFDSLSSLSLFSRFFNYLESFFHFSNIFQSSLDCLSFNTLSIFSQLSFTSLSILNALSMISELSLHFSLNSLSTLSELSLNTRAVLSQFSMISQISVNCLNRLSIIFQLSIKSSSFLTHLLHFHVCHCNCLVLTFFNFMQAFESYFLSLFYSFFTFSNFRLALESYFP